MKRLSAVTTVARVVTAEITDEKRPPVFIAVQRGRYLATATAQTAGVSRVGSLPLLTATTRTKSCGLKLARLAPAAKAGYVARDVATDGIAPNCAATQRAHVTASCFICAFRPPQTQSNKKKEQRTKVCRTSKRVRQTFANLV